MESAWNSGHPKSSQGSWMWYWNPLMMSTPFQDLIYHMILDTALTDSDNQNWLLVSMTYCFSTMSWMIGWKRSLGLVKTTSQKTKQNCFTASLRSSGKHMELVRPALPRSNLFGAPPLGAAQSAQPGIVMDRDQGYEGCSDIHRSQGMLAYAKAIRGIKLCITVQRDKESKDHGRQLSLFYVRSSLN